MVVVDAERCVRRFTSSARRMVNVIASDIGRPIGDIHWNVRVDDVDEMVRRAAESGTSGKEILAMRERIEQLGGEFDIRFTGHGTAIQVRVPLQESNR
jgi:signal transduction histidine kinase